MNIISETDLNHLTNLFIPNYFKLKIIDKIGLETIIYHFKEISSKITLYDKNKLLTILARYRSNELKQFFKNLDYDNEDNFDLLIEFLEDNKKLRRLILESIDIQVIASLLKTPIYFSRVIESLYNIRTNDVTLLLKDALKNNTYQDYINYNTPDYIIKKIVKSLSVDALMFDLENTNNYKLIDAIKNYRGADILDYVSSHSNNIIDIKNLLKIKLPISSYELLLSKVTIDDDFLLYLFDKNNKDIKEILFLKYKHEVYSWLDSLIENNNYLDVIRYQDDDVITYVVNKLSLDQINNLVKDENLTFYYRVKTILYKSRKDDIVKVILSNIKNDNTKIIEYLVLETPDDIINEVKKNINFDEKLLDIILECRNDKVIKNVFKEYKNEFLSLIRKKTFLDHNSYLDEYFLTCNYPLELQVELLKDISDDDIIYIMSDSKYTIRLEKTLFKMHQERILNLYNNLLKNDKLKAFDIFKTSYQTDFRTYLVNNLDFFYLYLFLNELREKERILLSKRFPNELRAKLHEEYINDPISFIKQTVFSNNDIITKIVIKTLTYDDIINVLSEEISYNGFVASNYELRDLLVAAVKNKASSIKNLPYPECLKFLKGLRKGFDFLFEEFLQNIDLDDEFLHTLFIERGLSNSQKEILFNFKKDDIKRIIKEKIKKKEVDLLEYVQKGTPDEILTYVLSFIDKETIITLINNQDFVNRKSIGKKFATELIIKTYVGEKNIELVKELSKCYSGDSFELIKNFEKIQEFLQVNNIDISKFFQYNLNSNYNFVSDIVDIYNHDLKLFLQVKNKLFSYLYKEDKYSSKNFLDFVKNYVRYKNLCVSFLEIPDLSLINFKNIKLLFRQNEVISSINSYSEVDNIMNIIKEKYLAKAKSCASLDSYKEFVLELLFGCNVRTAKIMLENYGGVCELLELKYYNLDKLEVLEKIDKVIDYTNQLESIVNCQELETLSHLVEGILDRLDFILTEFEGVNYPELMRDLYATEMNLNLSKVGDNVDESMVKLEDKSNEYGVDIYDFRDKQYVLLAHVISSSESIDDLVVGKSNGMHNFISMSAISHRMQTFYYNARNMILGYDSIPHDNFICSSIGNMGTNHFLKNNSSEVREVSRIQRGVLELSDTSTNSEILSLREGIKPKYIICPGRYPTNQEVECAKKYNLKIILTQPRDKSITSPKNIKITSNIESEVDKDYLMRLRQELGNFQNKERKIAILTDPHGLFEPTLTVLEDIRKRGITEIYSLGDNIGTGADSKSVVDILEQYRVRSIKGNHELYLIRGVDAYKEHLQRTNAYTETLNNVNWTSSQIGDKEKEIISGYDDYLELDINGKKVLLCHFLYDFNDDKPLYDIDKYDLIIQGHRHFYQKNDKVITLKAVGMGNLKKEDIGNATYMILSFKDNELSHEFVNVPYAYLNTINANNVSSNNCKEKMISWIGRK